MKRIVIAITALIISAGAFAQGATVKKTDDYVKFKEVKHDFGKIKQGVPVNFDFPFANVSEKPIVIESAMGSCGCTTPTWPQAPVAKGKDDKINAGFNAQVVGPFTKTITVKVAGLDNPVILTITGEVLTAEDYVKYEKEKGSSTSPKKG
jgi:hypothetical protein